MSGSLSRAHDGTVRGWSIAAILTPAGAALPLLVLALWWPGYQDIEIRPDEISLDAGRAYYAGPLPFRAPFGFEIRADTNDAPASSQLQLFENGRRIGRPHTTHSLIREAGRGSFSHWGDGIYFSTPDHSDPRANGRTYRVRAPWQMTAVTRAVAGVSLAVWLIAMLRRGVIPWRTAVRLVGRINASPTTLAAVGVAVAIYIARAFSRVMPLPSPDSYTYIAWDLPHRTPGYPLFLSIFEFVFHGQWQYLPLVQACALVAGLITLAVGIGALSRSWLAAAGLLAAAASLDGVLLYAQSVLTEPVFTAGVCAAAGLALMALARRRMGYTLASGLVMAFVCSVKPVAVTMPVALIPVAFTFPRGRRLLVTACLLTPALIYQAGYSAFATYRYGSASSPLGGLALFGHVAWAVTPGQPSRYPELTRRLADAAVPVVSRRPVLARLSDYATHTTNEYNRLLWGTTVPVTQQWLASQGSPSDRGAVADVLMTIAGETIRAHPEAYAWHVWAHYVACWDGVIWEDDLSQRFLEGRAQALAAYTAEPSTWRPRFDALLRKGAMEALTPQPWQGRLPHETAILTLTGAGSVEAILLKLSRVVWGASIVGLLLWPVVALGPCRTDHATLALISGTAVVSGLINVYFSTHAAAQVYLTRYAGVMAPLALALLVLTCAVIVAAAQWSRLVPMGMPRQPS